MGCMRNYIGTGTLLLLAMGLSTLVQAQHCHTALQGQVLEDDTNEPLAFAQINVVELQRWMYTDEQGYFAFADLCEGQEYTVEVRHLDCEHQTRIVRLQEHQTTDFRLRHNTVLAEVLVSAKALAPESIQSAQAIDPLDLASRQSQNLGEVVKQIPGVNTLNSGATVAKPVIQGLHSTRIALVNNGVLLESQQWGTEHAPEIDPFAAEQITVVKGAAGVRYGVGAMGGAIVLTPAPLREQDGVNGWVSTGLQSNGRGGFVAGAVDYNHHQRWALRTQVAAKQAGNLRAPDYWLGNTGIRELNASATLGFKHRRWQHETYLSHFNQRFGVLRAAHIGSVGDLMAAIESDTPRNNNNKFTYNIARPFQHAQHSTLRQQSVWRWSDTWKLTLQYSWQYNFRREYDVVRQTDNPTSRPQVSFRLWSNTLDAILEHRPIRHWEGALGVQAFQQTNQVSRGGFIPDYNSWGGSVFAWERWRRYPKRYEMEVGVRGDYRYTHARTTGNSTRNLDRTVQFANVSGVLGFMYRLSDQWSLKIHSGWAWRPPSVNELFARGIHHGAGTYERGDSNMVSEKAWNNQITLRRTALRGWEFELTAYRNHISDFIFLDPQNNIVITVRGPFPAFNFAQANAILQGIDLQTFIPIYGGWGVSAKSSILRAQREVARVEGGIEREWLPLMPVDRHQLGLRFRNTRWDAHGYGTYITQQTCIPAAGLLKAAPDAVLLFGLDANYAVPISQKRQLTLGLSIQNLTNQSYREYLNFFRFYADEPGFNLHLRAKLTF
jgi:iron complex outermembrane recepter protein